MKKTKIICDICKKNQINETDYNTIIDGKGSVLIQTNIFSPWKSIVLRVKVETTSQKKLERDICAACLSELIICSMEKSSQSNIADSYSGD